MVLDLWAHAARDRTPSQKVKRSMQMPSRRSRSVLVLLGALLVALAVLAPQSPIRTWIHRIRIALVTPPVRVGMPGRPFSVLGLDGKRHTILNEKAPMIVAVFTTWCPSCRQDVAVMKLAGSELRRQGVSLVALDQQESVTTVSDFVRSQSINYKVYIDDSGATQEVYETHLLPTLLYFDRSGVLRARSEGPIATGELTEMARRAGGS